MGETTTTDNAAKPEESIESKIEKALRNTLFLSFSAGKGGTGKSTISSAIAMAYAEAGLKVLLIDGDNAMPCIPTLLGIKKEEYDAVLDTDMPFRGYGDTLVLNKSDVEHKDGKIRVRARNKEKLLHLGRLVRNARDMSKEYGVHSQEMVSQRVNEALVNLFGESQIEGHLKDKGHKSLDDISLSERVQRIKEEEPHHAVLQQVSEFMTGGKLKNLDILYSGQKVSETTEKGLKKRVKRFYLENIQVVKEQAKEIGYHVVIIDNPAGSTDYAKDAMYATDTIIVTNMQEMIQEKSRECIEDLKRRNLFYSLQGLDLTSNAKTLIEKYLNDHKKLPEMEDALKSATGTKEKEELMGITKKVKKNYAKAVQMIDLLIGGNTELSAKKKEELQKRFAEKKYGEILNDNSLKFLIESEDDILPFYNSIRSDSDGEIDARIRRVEREYARYANEKKSDVKQDEARLAFLKKGTFASSDVGLVYASIMNWTKKLILKKIKEEKRESRDKNAAGYLEEMIGKESTSAQESQALSAFTKEKRYEEVIHALKLPFSTKAEMEGAKKQIYDLFSKPLKDWNQEDISYITRLVEQKLPEKLSRYAREVVEKIKSLKDVYDNPDLERMDELQSQIEDKYTHIDRVLFISGLITGTEKDIPGIRDALEFMEEGIHLGCKIKLILNKSPLDLDGGNSIADRKGKRISLDWSDGTGLDIGYVAGIAQDPAVMNEKGHFYLNLSDKNPAVMQVKHAASRIYELTKEKVSLRNITEYMNRRTA